MSTNEKDLEGVLQEIGAVQTSGGAWLCNTKAAARLILEARRETQAALARVRDSAKANTLVLARIAKLEECIANGQALGAPYLHDRIAQLTAERDAALARVRELKTHDGPKGNGGYVMVHKQMWAQMKERIAQLEADGAANARCVKVLEEAADVYHRQQTALLETQAALQADGAADRRLREAIIEVLPTLDDSVKEADNDDYYVGGMCGGGNVEWVRDTLRAALAEGEGK